MNLIQYKRKEKGRKMEKVDIILATYNGEQFLSEQIESILNQTYKEFRLFIADDCSTDKTRKIIEEYSKKDNRITAFYQEKNLGVVSNFEFLLKKVENRYFMFADQDDIWRHDKIEKSIKKIKESDSDLIYTDLEVVDSNLNTTYASYWKLKNIYHKIKKYNNFESLYLNNFVTGCTILAKKEIISKVLPLPKNSKYVLHDYWIPLIVSQNGKIDYIEEPLIQYRQHKNNKIGSKKKSDSINNFKEMRDLFIDVKKQHFTVFIENEDKFENEEIKSLNKKSLEYFKLLENIKYINFKSWKLFFKLYKYEEFGYKMQNFLILNMPCIAKILFKIKKSLSKKAGENNK